jgi:hypothetical protein
VGAFLARAWHGGLSSVLVLEDLRSQRDPTPSAQRLVSVEAR